MSLAISSWNTGQSLGKPELQDAVFGRVEQLAAQAGILVLSEVLHPSLSEAQTDCMKAELHGLAASAEHTLTFAPYEDEPKRSNGQDFQQYLAMSVHNDIGAVPQQVRLANRNGLAARFTHEGANFKVVGVHLREDGVKASYNIAQAEAYARDVGDCPDHSRAGAQIDVLIGDLNYLPPGFRARLMRLASPVTCGLIKLFGVTPAGPDMNRSVGLRQQFERKLSVAYRASQMGLLGAHRVLSRAGFKDADPSHESTHRLGQIDRALYRATEPLGLSVTCEVGDRSPSDHSPVTARFEI